MARFTGKVVLVTGGTSGIGKATAVAFAREGAKVVLSGRREKEGLAVAEEIIKAGGAAHFVQADVAKEADVERLVAATVAKFGRLDVAFNNAGVELLGPLTEATEAEYRRIFDVNVWGVLASMKYEVPAMLKTGGGAIVNTSSIAGHVGMSGVAVYVASKHAVEGLTKVAALEYAKQGIRVTAVAPAAIATDMIDRFTGGRRRSRRRCCTWPATRRSSPRGCRCRWTAAGWRSNPEANPHRPFWRLPVPKIAIVYFSAQGHTHQIAEAVAEGANGVAGTTAELIRIVGSDVVEGRWKNPEALAKLTAADAIVFGTPTYMGGYAAQFKAFIDAASEVWMTLGWKDKLAAGFTHSGGLSGDKLNTLASLVVNAMQHGMVWVGLGEMVEGTAADKVNRLSSFTGVMAQTDWGQETVNPGDRKSAAILGARVAGAAARWARK
jgi:NAD(P)H dehydrogenase (quinone)